LNNKINQLINNTIYILNNIDDDSAIEYSTWMKDKAKIKFEQNIPAFPITSNYIYWYNLGINIGSKQNKIRPVLIVKTKKILLFVQYCL